MIYLKKFKFEVLMIVPRKQEMITARRMSYTFNVQLNACCPDIKLFLESVHLFN